MLRPSDFQALVGGNGRGWTATLARGLLRLAEIPYCAAVTWRNRRYDTHRAAVHRVDVPVVSVGNLTLGGTGKTPFVAWLGEWFRTRGVAVAVVSRGYGARGTAAAPSPNDECLELSASLPGVPHWQDRDRLRAAHAAAADRACRAILLDDGFQHRRLARDLDIVLLDALEPFGYRHVFPRGMLREPLEGLSRAQAIVLTRADLVSVERRQSIRQEALRLAPSAVWLEARHAPRALRSCHGREEPIECLAARPVAAFCGIGNPEGFRRTLDSCNYQVTEFREFPDHFVFPARVIDELDRWARALPVDAVLCTHKDLVKVRREQLGDRPLWAVRIGLEILEGEDRLTALLERLTTTEARRHGDEK